MSKPQPLRGAHRRHARARTVLPDSTRMISATDAARNFGALARRVQLEGLVYLVRRSGTPVAQIVPVEIGRCSLGDLRDLLAAPPLADDKYLDLIDQVMEPRWAR